jgi:hypothetical protein
MFLINKETHLNHLLSLSSLSLITFNNLINTLFGIPHGGGEKKEETPVVSHDESLIRDESRKA